MILDPAILLDRVLFDYDPKNVGPNSYDLKVSRVFEIMGGLTLYADGRKVLPPYKEIDPYYLSSVNPLKDQQDPWFSLVTGVLYQVEFKETVKIPHYATAITIMRSSMSKSGASGETGLYDSGYEGNCGMTVSVKHGCQIQVGASIAQIVFMSAKTSQLYSGDYMDQNWIDRLVKND